MNILPYPGILCYTNFRIPGSQGQNVLHACMIGHLTLRPAKHEKVAIYAVNQRILDV